MSVLLGSWVIKKGAKSPAKIKSVTKMRPIFVIGAESLDQPRHIKYQLKGLHISEFVQNGSLNRYVGILIDELDSIENLEKDIEEVLNHIEKYVVFVKAFEKPRDVIMKCLNIVNSHSPKIFIVAGVKSASELVKQCIEKLELALTSYELEKISSKNREILFFKRKVE